mgnify:CR=1 FL=1
MITGPTASGKSQLTLELARHLGAEIISADSAQVYRGMDIGSAKPDAAALAEVKHHLIDIRDPDEPYSAAEFRKDCIGIVSRIQREGKLAIISGGTMLYLKGLKEGLSGDLLSIDLNDAIINISIITGKIDIDQDILGSIFSKFCIGK